MERESSGAQPSPPTELEPVEPVDTTATAEPELIASDSPAALREPETVELADLSSAEAQTDEPVDAPPAEPETAEARPSPLPQIILVLLVGVIAALVLKTYVFDTPVMGGVNKDGITSRPAFEPTRAVSGPDAKNPPAAPPSGQAAALPPPAGAGAAKVAQPAAPVAQPAAPPAAAPPAAAAPPSAAGKAALAATPAPAGQASDPDSARAAANAGNEAVQRGDLEAGIQQFTKAIQLDPAPVYYGLRGGANWRNKSLDAALADYNRSVELDPRNADNYFGRARVYKDMGKADLARQDLQAFLDLKPNTPAEAGIRQEAQQMMNDLR